VIPHPTDKTGRKRATLSDVAAKAGVSIATASVAVTGKPSGNCRVSPAVAARVREVARSMQYRPNVQARNLATRRTRTIAFLIKRASWHNAMFYVSAVQRVLREHGYTETFMLHPDNRLESERQQLELCVERRVEGIITIPVIDLDQRSNVELYNHILRREQIPIAQIGIALPGLDAPAMTTDDVEGFRAAVRLMHSMGHRRIAHVTIPGYDDPKPLNPFVQVHQRCEGYRGGMKQLGLAEQIFCAPGDWRVIDDLYERGYVLAREIAAATPRPTAVFAFVDHLAAGVMAGLRDAGVDVPGDISVLGFGDQPFGHMLSPSLSTLAPAFEPIAERATRSLLDMIDGKAGSSVKIAPSLVMRNSVRALRDDES
jgi:DNA-binding LacI/PurR family transcriptional regulator